MKKKVSRKDQEKNLRLVPLLLEELEAFFNVAVLEAPQGLLHALRVLAHVDTAPLLAGLEQDFLHGEIFWHI